MVRIRFSTEEDEINGYYLLATQASVRSLHGGIYEVTRPRLALLDQNSIKYEVISPAEAAFDKAQAVRDPLTLKL